MLLLVLCVKSVVVDNLYGRPETNNHATYVLQGDLRRLSHNNRRCCFSFSKPE